jgi:predicted Fe-Mo cluster-binding NifX family protein
MKKIAVPVSDNLLCAHFGHCNEFHIYDIENGEVVKEISVTPPPHEPGILPGWLSEQQVTDVIAGGMGHRAIDLFNRQNINVFVGAPVKPPVELVENHLNGSLVLSANYCDH